MKDFINRSGINENGEVKQKKKWNQICTISNIIFSVFYGIFSWLFTFLGIMFFSLGFSDKIFTAVCSFLASILFLLTPIFCILGIVLSVLLRKKDKYAVSFLIQFLPFCMLGAALVLFLLSVIIR